MRVGVDSDLVDLALADVGRGIRRVGDLEVRRDAVGTGRCCERRQLREGLLLVVDAVLGRGEAHEDRPVALPVLEDDLVRTESQAAAGADRGTGALAASGAYALCLHLVRLFLVLAFDRFEEVVVHAPTSPARRSVSRSIVPEYTSTAGPVSVTASSDARAGARPEPAPRRDGRYARWRRPPRRLHRRRNRMTASHRCRAPRPASRAGPGAALRRTRRWCPWGSARGVRQPRRLRERRQCRRPPRTRLREDCPSPPRTGGPGVRHRRRRPRCRPRVHRHPGRRSGRRAGRRSGTPMSTSTWATMPAPSR